ncbi:MAG: FGGY-family carbohydrate kinase [Endozoicomonas sp.]|uniref:FGGY-family carbohydrate kinase n=1 Tax=Endozoicomonas sp. TaxID=1892382 RepID=UPI003D9B50AC
MQDVLLSIDVGTASLRSALVNPMGEILAKDIRALKLWQSPGRMEQSSDDIYNCLISSVGHLIAQYHSSVTIQGIGIDATASQVLLNHELQPLYLPDNPEANILGWMDHRAQRQSTLINERFKQVADKLTPSKQIPEMCLSKMLWLEQTHPELWSKCGLILDLYDFLSWKLTGILTRTPCSMVTRESTEVLDILGINNHDLMQGEMLPIGAPIPGGLKASSANALGLTVGTPVATGIVDGLGGSLAVLGSTDSKDTLNSLENRLSMIVGTSTIYIANSRTAKTIEGAWGPIPSVLEGFYHNIVGQSAAGALIDHLIISHPAYPHARDEAQDNQITVVAHLNNILNNMVDAPHNLPYLTHDIHLLPYFAGNRCPRMDMSLRGMIVGLELDKSIENLALSYLACIQAIALGARHNIELLTRHGYSFSELRPCGGLAKNPLFVQEHVNVIGIPAKMPEEPDAMLLSGALVASVASGVHLSMEKAMQAMSRQKGVVKPNTSLMDFYHKKYRVFLELYEDQEKYRKIMNQ